MGYRLSGYVDIHLADGTLRSFGPGAISDEDAALIRNPDVWDGEPGPAVGTVQRPARNATKAAWSEYADELGIVTDGLSKEGIVGAVEVWERDNAPAPADPTEPEPEQPEGDAGEQPADPTEPDAT